MINTTENHSFIYFDDDDDRDFSHTLAIIQSSIYIPILCAGLVNNLLTILVILINRDMHTVTNCYLLNLAISDTLPLIVSLPFEISFFSLKMPWGEFGCRFRSLLAETSTNASILTISAFTVERYLAVCRPLHISSFSTTRRAIKIQAIIWFVAILSSTPYFYLTKKVDSLCQFDHQLELFVIIAFYISASLFFVLPVFILCFLYALMAQRLYSVGLSHQIRWSKGNPTTAESVPSPVTFHLESRLSTMRHASSASLLSRSHRVSGVPQSLNIHSMKKSAFKMLFSVVIAFIICYAPFHAQRVITSRSQFHQLQPFQRRLLTIFYFISGILYYLGSTINPIFYHLFSKKYRQACRRTMLRLVRCQRQQYKLERTRLSSARFVLYAQLPRSSMRVTTNEPLQSQRRIPNYPSAKTLEQEKRLFRLSLPDFHRERLS